MQASRFAVLAVLAAALSTPGAALATHSGQGRVTVIDGYVFVSPGRPVAQGRLRLLTLSGASLGSTGITGKNGTFTLRAAHLPSRFVLESAGGKDAGHAAPTLRTVVTGSSRRRFIHVNPATTLVAAVAARHPQWSNQTTVSRVKRYLGLPAYVTLGQSLHFDSSGFDGGEFLRQAKASVGLEAFTRARAAEIDIVPAPRRPFHHPKARVDAGSRTTAAAARSTDIGTTILTNIAGNVGGAVVKATIGDALAAAGLSNVANFLGLGNTSDQLDGIASQLAGVNSQLMQINSTVTSIQQGVANNNSAISQAEYTGLVSSSSVAGAVQVGTLNDPVLGPLQSAASFADDIASAAQSLPKAAQTSPQSWCAANSSLLTTGSGARATSTAYGDACTTIQSDMGATGGPTQQQIVKAGGVIDWCNAHQGTYLSATPLISPLAYYTCEVLTQTDGTFQRSKLSGFDILYPLASGTTGSTSIVQIYGQKLTGKLAAQAGAAPLFLTAANYSVPLDSVASDWASKIALLGLYASVYDAFTSPGATTCLIPGVTTGTNLAPADCDVSRGNAYAATFAKAPIALPDIPAGTFISFSSGTSVRLNSATATHWWLMPAPPTCPAAPTYQYDWTGISTPPTSASCAFKPATASIANNFGQQDAGWSLPPIGDLQALFTGNANPPGAVLTGVGLADLSSAKTLPLLPVQTVANAYSVANLSNPAAPATLTNTGTAYGLWSSTCSAETWNTGYVSTHQVGSGLAARSEEYEIAIVGTWCSYLGLQDGVTHRQCVSVSSTPGIPCSAPTTPGVPDLPAGDLGRLRLDWPASDGVLDFGHTLALLVERTPTAQQYWYQP